MIPSGWHHWWVILIFFGITSIPTYQLITSQHSTEETVPLTTTTDQGERLELYWKARFSHPVERLSINERSIILVDNEPEGDLSIPFNQKELSIEVIPQSPDTQIAIQFWASLPEQETKTTTYWIQGESTLTFYID